MVYQLYNILEASLLEFSLFNRTLDHVLLGFCPQTACRTAHSHPKNVCDSNTPMLNAHGYSIRMLGQR